MTTAHGLCSDTLLFIFYMVLTGYHFPEFSISSTLTAHTSVCSSLNSLCILRVIMEIHVVISSFPFIILMLTTLSLVCDTFSFTYWMLMTFHYLSFNSFCTPVTNEYFKHNYDAVLMLRKGESLSFAHLVQYITLVWTSKLFSCKEWVSNFIYPFQLYFISFQPIFSENQKM